MARPERHDVDYFPFFAKRGKTLNILQSKYGLEGIGFFTNVMRFLALTPDHHYSIRDEADRMNFFAEIGVDENKGIEMIELMVKTEKLDRGLWESHKVIASEAFLVSLTEAYKKRSNDLLTLDEIRDIYINGKKRNKSMSVREVADILECNPETIKNHIRELWPDLMQIGVSTFLTEEQISIIKKKMSSKFVGDLQTENDDLQVYGDVNLQSEAETYKNNDGLQVYGCDNPESKVKKSKVKKSKVNIADSPPDVSDSSSSPQSSEKPKKLPLRQREPVNDMERVEKAYLQNWDDLYSRKQVKAVEPVVNWNKTRALLKSLFEQLDAETIVQAVKNGMEDDWVVNTGYSLATMLSANVLNRLINTSGSSSPKHKIGTDNVPKEKVSSYFREPSV